MMAIIGAVIYIFILATAYPVAGLLAWLCEDEIVKDRKYFLWLAYFLIAVSFILMIVYFNSAILLSLAYAVLLMAFLVRKGKNNRKLK